jgi:hypothetical protein
MLLQKSDWWQQYNCLLSHEKAIQMPYYCMQVIWFPSSGWMPFSQFLITEPVGKLFVTFPQKLLNMFFDCSCHRTHFWFIWCLQNMDEWVTIVSYSIWSIQALLHIEFDCMFHNFTYSANPYKLQRSMFDSDSYGIYSWPSMGNWEVGNVYPFLGVHLFLLISFDLNNYSWANCQWRHLTASHFRTQ